MTKKYEIILVEDTPEDAELIQRSFKKLGANGHVKWFNNGKDSLEYIQATAKDNKPRILVLDYKMPGLSGKDVLERVRANEDTRPLPVIMFSSSNQIKDIEACYALGANSYVVKPSDFKEFDAIVSSMSSYWLELNETPHAG